MGIKVTGRKSIVTPHGQQTTFTWNEEKIETIHKPITYRKQN